MKLILSRSGRAAFALLAELVSFFMAGRNVDGTTLSGPSIALGEFSFTYDSSSDQLLTVQALDTVSGTWNDLEFRQGTGNLMRFATAAAEKQRFFRVKVTPFLVFDLEPTGPTLAGGAVSLADALAGSSYAAAVSAGFRGVPPYSLQVAGNLPDGVSVTVSSNGTVNAAALIVSSGAGLAAGQRRQFSVSGTDGAGATVSRNFDLRVIAPPPEILTTLVTMKAGETAAASMEGTNGTGALTWEIISGARPNGVSLSAAGVFVGAPGAEDAEFQLTGRFTNEVKVTDSLTDRVTGAASPRSATNTVVQLVKLSFEQNLFSETALGPRFSLNCTSCHGSSFLPDFSAGASSLIGVMSREDVFCQQRIYVIPGGPGSSLLYQKLAGPDCGGRMPLGGPYLEDSAIRIVERWIAELAAGDVD